MTILSHGDTLRRNHGQSRLLKLRPRTHPSLSASSTDHSPETLCASAPSSHFFGLYFIAYSIGLPTYPTPPFPFNPRLLRRPLARNVLCNPAAIPTFLVNQPAACVTAKLIYQVKRVHNGVKTTSQVSSTDDDVGGLPASTSFLPAVDRSRRCQTTVQHLVRPR